MRENFFKFPATPHLALLEGVTVRGDKILTETERAAFLNNRLIVEEKVDGANLGISFNEKGEIRAQNRGAYLNLPGKGQWKKLGEWLKLRADALFDQLGDHQILFGEWCYAQHSVPYDCLPDWFLGFDVYDLDASRFLSCERRDKILRAVGIAAVPTLGKGRLTLADLTSLLSKSHLGHVPAEGLYLRVEGADWLLQRAKLVRPAFIQLLNEHWSRSAIKPNRLCPT